MKVTQSFRRRLAWLLGFTLGLATLPADAQTVKLRVADSFRVVALRAKRASGQPDPLMYFWITGLLSSFLDNAPTYLVFFNAAGADPIALMGPMASTLMAISMGAVFMGANSYIGNAPNFMVKSMAESRGVVMPSFFGYLVWSFGLLMPLFALQSWLFF